MGNLGSRKKQKEDEITDDVWLKLNDDDNKSTKEKKKKKKKRKKKGKGDSPDKFEEDTSQCDTCSYSQSTLSSRKHSDSTIASAGTITQSNAGNETKLESKVPVITTDDLSNGSIGYVTASDTFTPPSPRKSRHSKFSPVIAQDSPRVVRRLLQSEKFTEKKNDESLENLSPRAKFFLATPETNKNTRSFENRKFNRHSSGSSIDSKILGSADEKVQAYAARTHDTRYITNGSLIVKSRQQENKYRSEHDSRLSNNSLNLSDSTAENLVRTGEKAKLIRYDEGNMSPAQRRKQKESESICNYSNNAASNILTFVKYDLRHPNKGVKDNFIDFIITDENKSESLPRVPFKSDTEEITTETLGENLHFKQQQSQLEIVPPPSPASGISLLEVEEIENESSLEKHLSRDDENFGDSVCKRLSLLLEAEKDSTKINRSEFYEFSDSPCSSPGIPDIDNKISNTSGQVYSKILDDSGRKVSAKPAKPSEILDCIRQCDVLMEDINLTKHMCESTQPDLSKRENNCNGKSHILSVVKTPQGNDNASVLDVMNNNFRTNVVEDTNVRRTVEKMDCSSPFKSRQCDPINLDISNPDQDIEEQMRYENEINEKLIEDRIKTLHEILPPVNESNKRNSLLCSISNKHANDPDNYILVTKKTYCVKRGILVELMDEEKDVITRDAVKILDVCSDWITTTSEEKYKPDVMIVEQGRKLVCPLFGKSTSFTESDRSGSYSEPDYANFDDFEEKEREFNEASPSDEEIDFENVLNRSQSQSDSEGSDVRHNRESDLLCDVISAYKDKDYSGFSDEVSEEDIIYAENRQTLNRAIPPKHVEYYEDLSDDEILYSEEVQTDSRKNGPSKVIRIPSKLDQSLRKIFQEKAQQLALSTPPRKEPSIADFDVTPTAEIYDQFQATGYDSPHHKSSEGSRRSLTYTESDLDASEKWEEDDASNDSMLADDEDDDEEFGEIIFSKPYLEHDEKADAMFSYNMVKTLPESPVIWEPPADDDDVFQEMPMASSVYHPEDDSLLSSDEAFDDARKQMQEIHEQLQCLREQMVTFENEEDDSSLPTSPLDDRILHIPKADTD